MHARLIVGILDPEFFERRQMVAALSSASFSFVSGDGVPPPDDARKISTGREPLARV